MREFRGQYLVDTLVLYLFDIQFLLQALQKCFESQDIPLLQQTIAAMPEEEARYHMKRCVDSGLWVPEAKTKEEEDEEEKAAAAAKEKESGMPDLV